jgi:hypothetical protein
LRGRFARGSVKLTTALVVLGVLAVAVPLLAEAMRFGLNPHSHARHRPHGVTENEGIAQPGAEGEEEAEASLESATPVESEPTKESLGELEPAPSPEPVAEPEAEPIAEPEPEAEAVAEPGPAPGPDVGEAVAVGGEEAAAPEPAPAPAGEGRPLYWGAWIGSQLTGTQAPWDMGAVAAFEQMTGKGLSLIQFATPFANCASTCYSYPFPAGPMESIRNHGSIPVLGWASQSIPSTKEEPDFQLSDVLAGTYDSYIREFAAAAKSWGHPFFLRFNWEMNGHWFPWSEGVNGNQPGEYVAAWRHVHDIFTSVGATNASWVWCPNIDPNNAFLDLASQYPGDAYVDWTCLDGYNWGTNPVKPDRWRSFDELYESTYGKITETIAPSKPMLIGEFGSTEYGGSKAAWIEDALARIPAAYPKIRGALYFEKYDSNMDWPIETSVGATQAFADGIRNGAFQANHYADLSATPIPPPS